MFGTVYQGFYKTYYIRSSYEYVYLKILEKLNIKFEMELNTYQFKDGSYYTPDFFILDDCNNIIKIVEIKAEDKNYYNEGLKTNQKMLEEFNINIEMLSITELKKLCKENQISFDELSQEWKDSPNSTKKKDNHGIRNPMYNKHQSEHSKKLNGEKTKDRFKNNKEFKKLHSKKVKEAMQKVDKEKLKFSNRRKNKKITCCICGKEEIVYTSQSIYCDECRNSYTKWELQKLSKNKK